MEGKCAECEGKAQGLLSEIGKQGEDIDAIL